MEKIINRGFIAGVLVTLVFTMAFPAFGSVGAKMVKVSYDNIKITLNGQQITPRDGQGNIVEPFIYEGTTYLPIRAVANALGLAVDWDSGNKTVILGTGAVSGDWSKDNPAHIGAKINIDTSSQATGDGWKGSMRVGQVLRGEEANKEFNQSTFGMNKIGEGQEIILIKIYVETASDSGAKWGIGATQFFTGYSGYNDRLAMASYGAPNDGDGYVWRSYIVDKSDTQPKLSYETAIVKNAWFKLY